MNNIKENIINKMKSHSHEILELQKEYLSLQAKASFLKDKTEAIKLKILSESEFFAEDTLERILTITDDFTMSNNDFKTYYSLVREDQDKIGIAHENPKYCSQLVAENDLREHETKIFKFIMKNVVTWVNSDYFDHDKFREDCSKHVVDCVNLILIKDYDLPIKLEFESLYRPRFYNYETDSINVKATYSDNFQTLMKTYLNDNKEKFKEYLKKYTSCSGFISFMPDDVDTWISYVDDLNSNSAYLGSILEFYLNNELDTVYSEVYTYCHEMLRCNASIDKYIDYDKLITKINETYNIDIKELDELENINIK